MHGLACVTKTPTKCWGFAKKIGFGLFQYLFETVLSVRQDVFEVLQRMMMCMLSDDEVTLCMGLPV